MKLFLSLLLFTSQALAGLPPTTSKSQLGSKSATFNFQAPMNQFTKTGAVDALIETGNGNLLANPGFEATTYSSNWTASAGASAVGTSTDIGTGLKSYTWDASAASQTLTSDAITIPAGLYGANGEVTCSFKTAATDYVIEAWDGSAVVGAAQTIAANSFQPAQGATFIFPSSGTIALKIVSASDAAVLDIDDCYLGVSRNIGSVAQAQFVGSWDSASTTNCSWSTTSTSLANFAADTDCPTPSVSGSVTAAGTKIPAAVVLAAPAGEYLIEADVQAKDSTTAGVAFAISDGTTTSGYQYQDSTNNDNSFHISARFSYTTAGDRTFNIQGSTSTGTISLRGDVAVSSTGGPHIKIYKFPAASENVLRLNVDPTLTNWTSYTTTLTGFGTPTAVEFQWRRDGDSEDVRGIFICGTSTAVAGSFTLPNSNTVKSLASQTVWNSGRWNRGPSTGSVRKSSNLIVTQAQNAVNFGNDDYTTAQSAFSAQLGSNICSSGDVIEIEAHGIPITGWTAPTVSMPLVTQSVISAYSGVSRMARAKVASVCTANPCTITAQSGEFSSIGWNATGSYTINWVAGMWSNGPTCSILPNNGSNPLNASNGGTTQNSTSTYNFSVGTTTAGTFTNASFDIICMGPK